MQPWSNLNATSFDVETSGTLREYALQPWRVAQDKAWLTSYATSGVFVSALTNPAPWQLKEFLQYAIDHKLTIVGWNVAFDAAWCIAYGCEAEVMQLNWLDGMLLWRHVFIEPEYDMTKGKKKSYGLKMWVAENVPAYADYGNDIDFAATDEISVAERLKYNKLDAVFTLAATKRYYNVLLQTNPRGLKAALIEAECIPLVAKAIVNGLNVDEAYTAALSQSQAAEAARCLSELSVHGVTEKIVRSPKQLRHLMFDVWGLNPIKNTPNGDASTDKEVLHELSFYDPRAKTLRQYREALGNETKFPAAITNSVTYNGDGKTHPSPFIFGTYSSRFTYASKQGKNKDVRQTGFAIHQMKRGAEFRNELCAPPGYTIVEFDAAGQEFRWMAVASGDETMLELCALGEDAHSYMAAQIDRSDYREMIAKVKAKDEVAGQRRFLGKVANLSLQYRTSAAKLCSVARVQYDLPMQLNEAKAIRGTYLRTYKNVPIYWDTQIRQCTLQRYAETFAGRRVQLLDSFSGDKAWSLASTAINYRIQGTGADQKYLAFKVLKSYTIRYNIIFAWELHDGLYFYVPDALVSKCVPEMQTLLNTLPYEQEWGFKPPIPMPWDAKYGKSWGDMVEWKVN